MKVIGASEKPYLFVRDLKKAKENQKITFYRLLFPIAFISVICWGAKHVVWIKEQSYEWIPYPVLLSIGIFKIYLSHKNHNEKIKKRKREEKLNEYINSAHNDEIVSEKFFKKAVKVLYINKDEYQNPLL